MFFQLLAIERRKLTGRALLWVELAILALLVLALHAAIIAALQQPQPDLPPQALDALRAALRWPQGLRNALTFANGGELGGLFAVVLAAAVVAQEYTWRTVHLWLGRGVPRGAHLGAKFVALAGALLLFVLTALLAGGAATAAYTWRAQGALPWHDLPWADLTRGVLMVWLTLLPYAAWTLAVAVLSRSTLTATGVGLGYSLLVENLAAEVLLLAAPDLARWARYLPGMAAQAALDFLQGGLEVQVGMGSGSAAELLAPGTAVLLLLAYTAAGLTLAAWAFRRQDIPG